MTVRHPGAAQLVIGATQFLVLLDSLMVAVALPVLDRELALTATELPWVVNAYTLALAGGLLVAGGRPTCTAGAGCCCSGCSG